MSNPLVSVIIPVYNVEEYLEECLESVLNQTYDNIEIIAVNDGSKDNSLKILEEFALKNDNIKVISQKNLGQSVARNNGIKKASGKYIYFLDSDDYILPQTFEQLIKTMEENKLDLIRFGAEPFVDNIEKKINSNQYDFSEVYNSDKIYNKEDFLKANLKTFWPSPVLYIVRKDVIINNNIFYKPGIIHEDVLFTLEVFLNSHFAMYNPNFYYKRRYRPNSVMTSKSMEVRKKSFDSRCIILGELNRMLKKYTNKLELKLIRKRINSVLTSLLYGYQDLDKSYRMKKIREIAYLPINQYIYCVFRKRLLSRFLN